MTTAHVPSRGGRWLNALLHPLPLGMLALLLANDHILKVHYPGWVSGKLSDVAGLALLPFVLLALADLAATASPRIPAPGRRMVVACILATAAIFTAMQVTPLGADAYRLGLGVAQWPFHAAAFLLQGGPIPSLHPVQLTSDPSDLLALPATAAALLFISGGTLRSTRERHESGGSRGRPARDPGCQLAPQDPWAGQRHQRPGDPAADAMELPVAFASDERPAPAAWMS